MTSTRSNAVASLSYFITCDGYLFYTQVGTVRKGPDFRYMTFDFNYSAVTLTLVQLHKIVPFSSTFVISKTVVILISHKFLMQDFVSRIFVQLQYLMTQNTTYNEK